MDEALSARTAAGVSVGIPRTLFYYTYFPMWKRFFAELGAQVVASGHTSKQILDDGVRVAVTDACVPVKVMHGHVLDLVAKKVDFLFLPRVVCTNRRTVYCPKFLGLPDMIRSSVRDLPRLIDVRFDARAGRLELLRAAFKVGRLFTGNKLRILRALGHSLTDLRRYKRLLVSGLGPQAAMGALERQTGGQATGGLRFAVVGYPYIVHDRYLSLDLLGKLRRLGVEPVTVEMVPPRELSACQVLRKDLFWTYSDEAVRAAHYYLERPEEIDGLIHLTAFGCGPDSVVDKVIELMAKKRQAVPFMSLMIDEHTGEAGLMTRLEAFTDLVRRRKRRGAAERAGAAKEASSGVSGIASLG
ncbi:MAG: acyl-CoA dehydratase activase-related protein [Bacillota bacterium]|nr:acyl-CoA dehydratase activase-related protein [Bacillota bacterium]